MLNPFLRDMTPDELPTGNARPVGIALLPVLAYVLVAVAFLSMSVAVPSLAVACLFATAAAMSLGAGVVLGMSVWIFPQLSR
ncbi:hypothetical protein GFK26_30465 [Variovorax paradoxus]|uniref:Uncharacterized protein n=1 Tax=Variovorax paradoxus TaxID=34073 RepID=A0A5Q0ME55_VARPD|nr:hypothetical protein [Variovorax paradoxus]QFZ86795.1 hypothetical protein GFK26_30465 [Variovorax paradoxus]